MGHYYGGEQGDALIERFKDRGFTNDSEFARFLTSVEPVRSQAAWRIAISRWKKKGNEYIKKSDDYIAIEQDTTITRTSSYYDEGKDQYLTFLEELGEILVVDGEAHRGMRKSYSDITGGFTADEMARKFGIPPHWASEYIRAWKWRHAMDPFTDDEVLKKNTDELVQDLIFEKRQQLAIKSEKAIWRATEKDAEKYRILDITLLTEFRELISETRTERPERLITSKLNEDTPYAVVISPTDLHYGKYGWSLETGDGYNLEEAESRLMEKTQNLIDRLPSRPEKVIVATGSDWFHIDNDHGSTTKGTSQDLDGTPAQILLQGCDLAVKHIEMLRKVSDVEIVFMSGNHDRFASLALMMYLKAVYAEANDVTIRVNPQSRQYVVYRNNLLGFTHGDLVKSLNLPLLMANEMRDEWGNCENHVWFHGHKHHTHMIEKGNCFVIQLPSLSGRDNYHARHGFINRPGMFAHLIDAEQGIIGSLYAPVMIDG